MTYGPGGYTEQEINGIGKKIGDKIVKEHAKEYSLTLSEARFDLAIQYAYYYPKVENQEEETEYYDLRCTSID